MVCGDCTDFNPYKCIFARILDIVVGAYHKAILFCAMPQEKFDAKYYSYTFLYIKRNYEINI